MLEEARFSALELLYNVHLSEVWVLGSGRTKEAKKLLVCTVQLLRAPR